MSDESPGLVLRTCTKCGVSKPSNRFLQTGVPGEYHAVCKACESITQAEEHKAKLEARKAERQALRAERSAASHRAAQRKWRKANRVNLREKRREEIGYYERKAEREAKEQAARDAAREAQSAKDEAAKQQARKARQEAALPGQVERAKQKAEAAANIVARRELASRNLARTHMLPYVLRMHPGYQAGWIHKDICLRLEKFSAEVAAGLGPRLALHIPPRHGKLCADSTPVLTTRGWTTHGELRPGAEVFGPDGRPTRVVARSDIHLATMEVVTTDGEVIKCHACHEWTVYDRITRQWRTVETGYLASRAVWNGGRAAFQLPKRAALEFPEQPLPMDPYVLGAWLGDGSTGKPCITHAPEETEVIEGITACGYKPSVVQTHQTTGVKTTSFAGGVRLRLPGAVGSPATPVATV